MIQRKKLIEVALPLEAINKASAREKSIRHGHPSTLHLWWARRPLAAARAVIFAQLVDDPSAHPDRFPTAEAQEQERQRLFRLIEQLVQWENTTNEDILQQARDEIWQSWRATCAAALGAPASLPAGGGPPGAALPELFNPDKLPAFHDPFAGGGSLPLEAQRLGLEAYASDLNPVAVLINKAMIEIPPKFAGQPPVNPGARGEGLGIREEHNERDQFVQGSDSLAEGDGPGGSDLPADQVVSADRGVSHDGTDDARRSVSAGQYRGGSHSGDAQGVRPVHFDSAGFIGGGGDLSDSRNETRLYNRGADPTSDAISQRGGPNADEPTPAPDGIGDRDQGIGDRAALSLTPKTYPLFPKTYRGAQGLAEDVRYYGQWMRDEAEKRIGHLYPKIEITPEMAQDRPDLKPYVGRKLTVIAWLWARTVKSPNPAFAHVDVPLASTFMLSTKPGKEAYVEPVITGSAAIPGGPPAGKEAYVEPVITGSAAIPGGPPAGKDAGAPGYRFTVKVGKPRDAEAAKNGTKLSRGANFRCVMSGTPISGDHIKAEGQAGRMGVRLMAIVAEGDRGRVYLSPTLEHEAIALQAEPMWKPETPLPDDPRNFWTLSYGLTTFGDLFTPRQLVALTTFSDLVQEAREQVRRDALAAGLPDDGRGLDAGGTGAMAYADAVAAYLAFALSKQADLGNSLCRWEPVAQCPRQLFGRQAIPMIWDYAEGNPLGDSSGAWVVFIEGIAKAFAKTFEFISAKISGSVQQADAGQQKLSRDKVVSTDPPYYDNIGYADLSDFFYVWLRQSLRSVFPGLFATMAVPKAEELVATPYRHGSKLEAEAFFLDGMTRAMHRLAVQAHPAFPVTIYYAFKQTETASAGTASTGWETFLDAVIQAGFAITGTWPMRTENDSRMIGQGTNALASSIVLVCRPRPAAAPPPPRREFLSALKAELPVALVHLQRGNIAPVDLAQAAIGPGMAVYTRYAQVLDATGRPLSVREALALINQTLDETLAEQEGDFDADTRWALAWFDQFGFHEGEYGVAETLSKAKNTSVGGMVNAGILVSRGGKVRLLRPDELSATWDPTTDPRLTVWETVHQLVRALEAGGESAAATLVAQLGSGADIARELAYRLYTVCERKKRAGEALSYNALVQSWPEIARLARDTANATRQQTLFQEE